MSYDAWLVHPKMSTGLEDVFESDRVDVEDPATGNFELVHIGSSIQMYGLDISIFLPGPHRRNIL